MITNIESKVAEVITRSTLVKETENHVFKITNYEAGKTTQRRIKGTIRHKDGTICGYFVVNSGVKRMLSVNINMECKADHIGNLHKLRRLRYQRLRSQAKGLRPNKEVSCSA